MGPPGSICPPGIEWVALVTHGAKLIMYFEIIEGFGKTGNWRGLT